jgi:dCMP deaminase
MKERHSKAHMRAAQIYADLSYCNKRKVGCVVVKNDRIISIGYNGTPSGADNQCEDASGHTFDTVIHAEDNAIRKLEQSPETGDGAVLFVTTAPCIECAFLIFNFGIREVYYNDAFKNEKGIQYLQDKGVVVTQLPQ